LNHYSSWQRDIGENIMRRRGKQRNRPKRKKMSWDKGEKSKHEVSWGIPDR